MPVQDYPPEPITEAVRWLLEQNTGITQNPAQLRWVWNLRPDIGGTRFYPAYVHRVEDNAVWDASPRVKITENVPPEVDMWEGMNYEKKVGFMLDILARELYMEPDDLSPAPPDGMTPSQEQMPTWRINRKRRYNVHMRMRQKGDLESQPMYSTVSIYPAMMVRDEHGKAVDPTDERAESIWIEFGPSAYEHLKKEGEKDHGLEYDLMIPTLDPNLVLYVGTLVQRRITTPQVGWFWDVEGAHDMIALMHERMPEELRPEEVPPGMDPFIAVLRRGKPA